MSHIMTVHVTPDADGRAGVSFFLSDGMTAELALLAARAVEDALIRRMLEAKAGTQEEPG